MKKLVLVLGLVMGSMLASDAIAAVSINGNTVEHNDGAKHRKKKNCKKACCNSDAAATPKKGCSKEGSSCCKKKTTTEAPAPSK